MIPIINWNMCDGCGKCAAICPQNVFELKEISNADYKNLRWFGKMKIKVKSRIKSNVINTSDCIGCGECADNCHERAIKFKGKDLEIKNQVCL